MHRLLIALLLPGILVALAGCYAVDRVEISSPDRWAPAISASIPRAAIALSPDVASYVISATLTSDGKTVIGDEVISYRNPSTDALRELYFHLYLNAFRSPDTVWMREAGQRHRGMQFDAEHAGSISVDSISSDGVPLRLALEGDETIASVRLPREVAPGEQVAINVKWTARLPRVFARTGWAPGGFTLAGQWYPKLAVYDPRRGGWDREPWHANAEFFHDFGSYELTVIAPSQRTVVASGEPAGPTQDNDNGTSTSRFSARSVSDVVWMAGENFTVATRPAGGLVVQVVLPSAHAPEADHHLSVTERALQLYQDWLGPYPWPRISVVFPPDDAEGAGGMEYPTFVTSILQPAGLPLGIRMDDVTTVHELGHQWFPMQLASDEARDPWLDEAFADYLAQRALAEMYGADRSIVDLPFIHSGYLSEWRVALPLAARLPITRPSWEYTTEQYGAAVYAKGGLFLTTLERIFGAENFTRALSDYVTRFRWQHPLPDDFRSVLEQHLDGNGSSSGGVSPSKQNIGDWLDQLAFGERVLDIRVSEANRSHAVVDRIGDATLPVDGVLELESGRRMIWSLPAESTSLEVRAPEGDAIVVANADPESRLLIESNRLDDGFSVTGQGGALAGIWAKLAQLAVLAFQWVGLLG